MTEPSTDRMRTAVVTGASSGIGAATARRLAAAGFHVICAARRADRLRDLATDIDGKAVECDVTDAAAVRGLAEAAGSSIDVLVNNAGLALGIDSVADGSVEEWRRMYDVNVIGSLNVTQALLPALLASGDAVLVNMCSTAGHIVYEGGGGYTAAKHGVAVLTETLRLEMVGKPIRITEICPGMVATEEFSLVRFHGDQQARDRVYAGVPDPLSADDVADAVTWVATRPSHVDIDQIVMRPRAQAAQHKVHRET